MSSVPWTADEPERLPLQGRLTPRRGMAERGWQWEKGEGEERRQVKEGKGR